MEEEQNNGPGGSVEPEASTIGMRVVQRSGRPSASGDTDRRFPSRVKRAAKRRLARQQRLVKEHQLQEKVAARASAGGPVTRAAAEDIRAAEGHPQKEQRFQGSSRTAGPKRN